MGTVNVTLGDGKKLNLILGQQLENAVTAVVFDFSAWQTEFGSGTLGLSVQRHGDTQPYAVVPTVSGTNATWNISELDTAYKGVGEVQVTYTVGSVVKKSTVYKFTVYRSLGENGEYPSPGQTWQEEIEQELTDVKQDLHIIPDLFDNIYLSWSDGLAYVSSVACCSDFVEISPNVTGSSFVYCGRVNDGTGASLVFYDSNKSPISPYYRAWDDNPATISIPSGAKYFRLSCRKTSKANAYVKYNVNTVNKDIYEIFRNVYNRLKTLYDYPSMIDNLYLSWSDGQAYESSVSCASDYIELDSALVGTYLTYCGQVNDGTGASLVFYDSSKNPITPYYRAWDDNPATVLIPSGAKYYRLSCKNASKSLAYVEYSINDSIKNLYKSIFDLTIEENALWR